MSCADLELADIKTPKFTLRGKYTAKCVKVYDGDTIQIVFRPFGGKMYRFSGRMIGYNSAEIKSKDPAEHASAIISRDALKNLVFDKILSVEVTDFDKYGRLLIRPMLGDIDVCEWMVLEKHGRPYDGHGEKLW